MPKLLKNIEIDEVSLVDNPANPKAKVALFKRAEPVDKKVWTTAYVNSLPDSAFAVIEPGGEKDEEGKTTPRSLRHLPYKDAEGNIDPAHVRNALARLPQTQISDALKAKAKRRLMAAAKEVGIEVAEETKKGVESTPAPGSENAEGLDLVRLGGAPASEAALAGRLWKAVRGLFRFEKAQDKDVAMDYNEAKDRVHFYDEWWKLVDPLRESIGSILDDADVTDKKAAVSESIGQFQAAVLAALDRAVTKSEKKEGGPTMGEVNKEQKPVETPPVAPAEDVTKAEVAELKKQLEALKTRAEEAEKIAKAEKEARERAEIRKRAEAYANAGPVDDMAEVLFKAYGVSQEYGQKLESLFKAAHERIATGNLFKEIGGAGSVSATAWSEVQKRASELRKSDPKLTPEQALEKVFEADPELEKAYAEEVRQ